ncbi:MAG: hypothetical protein WDM81_18180 [Rhizomicrobium sp.]
MMIVKLRALCACLALAALSACISSPEDLAAPPSGQDSYVVLGVAPADMNLQIVNGRLRKGVFSAGLFRLTELSYKPDDGGYVVMKVPGNADYAVVSAVSTIWRQSFLGEKYVPSGAKTLVFEAPAGKVVYVTSLQYRRGAGRLDVTPTQDLERARAYLHDHYPALAGRLTQARYAFLPLQ